MEHDYRTDPTPDMVERAARQPAPRGVLAVLVLAVVGVLVELTGFVLVVLAAFMVDGRLGLATLGVVCIAAGTVVDRSRKGGDG